MNKAELIDAVATSTGLRKFNATTAAESIFSNITTILQRGDKVSLVGFGAFSVSRHSARMGRNPRTNETITIAASGAPKFKLENN